MSGHASVRRGVESKLRRALGVFRVVVLHGARQSGKTTLARRIVDGGTFLSLDDPALLSVALDDPMGFVADRVRPVVIDEVQRGGDGLVRAVKMVVDSDPAPGAFLLTGSADFLTVPALSESLAGRAVFLDLAPFSEVEIQGCEAVQGCAGGLLARLLEVSPRRGAAADHSSLLSAPQSAQTRSQYAERICRGGYPEAVRLNADDRRLWFSSYVRSAVSRDIVELTGARRSFELPRLLRAVAARTSGELVMQDLHRDLEFGSIDTTSDYLSHLEMACLATRLPGWATGAATRAKRRPKLHMADTGLAAAMLGLSAESLSDPAEPSRGPMHETFAVGELRRQASALTPELHFSHYRDSRGREVDFLIERPDGRIIAVEVKAGSTVRPADAKWLAWLRDLIGDRFDIGVVLYTGRNPLRLTDRILALPMSYLWQI